MNFEILSKVIDELVSLAIKARVERIYENSEKAIIIIFRSVGKKFTLLIVPQPSLPRLHLVAEKPPAAFGMHPFTQFLKSRMTGAGIASITLLNRDRVVEIRFVSQGVEYKLIVELFGSASNAVITDAGDRILSVYRPIPLTERSQRALLPGANYALPNKKKFVSSNEIMVNRGELGTHHTFSANRNAEIYYDWLADQQRFDSFRKSLISFLRKISTKLERKLQALYADQKAAHHGEYYKCAGDLILSNLHSLRTGMTVAELEGYDNKIMVISLDPRRSPVQNADHYYKKYKKAKTGSEIIALRLAHAAEEISFLQLLLSEVQAAQDLSSLSEIRAKLEQKGFLHRYEAGKRKAHSDPSSSFRRISFQGWEIIVGKSAAGNDFISTRIVRSEDLWLHAEGLPGSHVLIRNPNKRDVPPEIILKAASLAAFHSKGKSEGKVSVTYTRGRYIKKPKGAKAGSVTLSCRKTIVVAPQKE